MTTSQKRVQLARDIIAQIKSKKLKPFKGSLFKDSLDNIPAHLDISAQKVFKTRPCKVCAKGAVVIAYVRRFNEISLDDLRGMSFNKMNFGKVLKIFPRRFLAEMETLYEKSDFHWNIPHISYREMKGLLRVELPKAKDDRIIAIMELLIKNRGRKIILPQRRKTS